jgi:glycosyltransferase involved in cell wall biosynthesis
MKVLLGSHHFSPSVGGIETASELLAREFVQLGHDVRVVTQTKGESTFVFSVIRRPTLSELLRQVTWCDIFLQNNISLRTMWPLLFVRRPLFITHQTWIVNPQDRVDWSARLKLFALRFGRSIAISHAIAQQLPIPAVVIGNPYDNDIFTNLRSVDRERDLIYVGRLVSDKGVDLLIDALSILRESGVHTQLTIVGNGPERIALETQVRDLKLQSSVEFVGSQTGKQLAGTLNRHRILIVPSRWPEPFGIVAVEAIACGCIVVGSNQGGLPEAIGPCGITFPNNDAHALAKSLTAVITDQARPATLISHADSHLAGFGKTRVAQAYLELFNSVR